jgi:5-methylcytosine-specific restriction enzyme B
MASHVQPKYITRQTLKTALERLYGTADHLLKIWFTLKQMGMAEGKPPVIVTTASPNEALVRLYAFGNPEDALYVPFAHTTRFLTMRSDAGRSIIQTNIQRWATSNSVVTCNPTSFLDIRSNEQEQLLVGPARTYPIGLGLGKNGFALEEGQRVSVPDVSFAVWYFRQADLDSDLTGNDLSRYLVGRLRHELQISEAEAAAIFVPDDLSVATSSKPLGDSDVFQVCSSFIAQPSAPITEIVREDFSQHSRRIRSMKTITEKPQWLNQSPAQILSQCIESGSKAILLFGPPRTGKTRAIDLIVPRDSPKRVTIQIHDGWGYDNLIEGFRPDKQGNWSWDPGPLKKAITSNKTYIVLEEINRTNLVQALGEVFSLIEDAYRGEPNKVSLRSGDPFWIPENVVFLMTMNTLDKSTEDIDDAMMGRFSAVEFPPRIEDLAEMLTAKAVAPAKAEKLRDFFAFVQEYYPLGHGYFAALTEATDPIMYYLTRVRPVLANHFKDYKPEQLDLIDNKIESLFGKEAA